MIQVIKLISGEELLCAIKDKDITNPCIITHLEGGEITFRPYAPYTKKLQLVKNTTYDHIIWTATPDKELQKEYEKIIKQMS
jgi:hypothetical protein